MRTLLALELNKVLRSKWFATALLVAVALAVASAVCGIASVREWESLKEGGVREYIVTSKRGSYGRSLLLHSNLPREAFFQLVALLAALAGSCSLRSELDCGVANQMLVRASRSRYLASKCIAVFCSGALVVGVPLALNFLVLSCALPGYAPEALDNLYIGLSAQETLSWLLYSRPLLYLVVNLVVDAALCGIWSVLVLAASLVIKNRVILLAGSYLLTLGSLQLGKVIFYIARVGGFRFDMISVLEGVCEGPLRSGVAMAAMALLMLAVSLATLRLRRDGDVL
ncbi:hypothetical protein [Olsenella phocaeensis]|uniref:hypothetical protein n=1 Tax=Olsenella phocaeensis TaxID=1852385 RepID=UPI003A93357E